MIIYTVNINNYDKPKPIKNNNPKYRYVYVTNTHDKIEGWEIYKAKDILDPARTSRYYKINSHLLFPDEEYTLYVDSSYFLIEDFTNKLLKEMGNYDLLIRKHYARDCIYKEAEYLLSRRMHRYGDGELIPKQIELYKKEGYPKDNGLIMGGIILRRHTKEVKKFNEMWWDMIKNYSSRDQLSFNYVAWKQDLKYKLIEKKFLRGYIKKTYHGG